MARGDVDWLSDRLALTDGDCLEWLGPVQENGYGTWGGSPAHRRVWEALVGPIPEGHDLDHRADVCSSRVCAAPWHLEPVTHFENMQRARPEKCRTKRHDLPPAVPGIPRRCRPCNREWQRERGRQ